MVEEIIAIRDHDEFDEEDPDDEEQHDEEEHGEEKVDEEEPNKVSDEKKTEESPPQQTKNGSRLPRCYTAVGAFFRPVGAFLRPVGIFFRDSYRAIFANEPLATDAFRRIVKQYWVVTIFLLVSTLVKVLDTVSDVLVTVDWWRNDGQVNSRRSYARFSVAILAVSTFVSLVFSAFGPIDLENWGSRIIVVLFSLLALNVVPWAAIIWLDVWSGREPPEDVFNTEGMDINSDQGPKAYWKFMKALEFILEAAPEITLQSYVAAFEFFDDDKTPSVLLQLSITVSVLSIAAGVSTTYLCYESFKVQIWGTCFFAGALIARIAICAFAFVEFGRLAMIFVAIIVVLRLGIFGHMSGWRGSSDVFDGTKNFLTALLLTLPSLVIEMIVPLGYRNQVIYAENTVFWGSIDRSDGMLNTGLIAFFGDDYDTQGVRSRLESPLAYIMIALHVVENLIMLVIIAAVPHRAQRAQVGAVPLVAFVVVPMLVAAAAYYMLHRTTKNQETKWTTAIDALIVRLKCGLLALPMDFSDKRWYILGELFSGAPTVEKCEKLKEEIQRGILSNPRKREALDLLLLGEARLRAERPAVLDVLATHIVGRLSALPEDAADVEWLFDGEENPTRQEEYAEMKHLIHKAATT